MSYLPGALMPKTDIATMAVGLEARSPFLDHELIELTSQIPSTLKIKGFNNKKYILKRTLENFIPEEILHRPKMGFGLPVDIWFKDKIKNYTHETILSPQTIKRNIFQKEKLKKLLSENQNGISNHAFRIWSLLMLELWFREYFE
jgi:asparagine synthase (glutamine-hydrolysing)